MNLLQKIALAGAVVAIAAVNIGPAMPVLRKKPSIPLGPEDVFAYEPRDGAKAPLVPVFAHEGFRKETGEHVHLYLHWSFFDGSVQRAPRLTLLVLGGSVALFVIAGLWSVIRRRGRTEDA